MSVQVIGLHPVWHGVRLYPVPKDTRTCAGQSKLLVLSVSHVKQKIQAITSPDCRITFGHLEKQGVTVTDRDCWFVVTNRQQPLLRVLKGCLTRDPKTRFDLAMRLL